jgi:terminase, large subunit
VYEFCRQNAGRKFYAVKGANTPGKSLVSKPTLQGRPAVKLFTVGTETAKDTLMALLKINEPGPGYCHFPEQYSEDGNAIYDEGFFKQLLSEKPLEKYVRGVKMRVWTKTRKSARNEALDCRVYAAAAFGILQPNLKIIAEKLLKQVVGKSTAEDELPSETAQKPQKKPSFLQKQRQKGGFVQGWR